MTKYFYKIFWKFGITTLWHTPVIDTNRSEKEEYCWLTKLLRQGPLGINAPLPAPLPNCLAHGMNPAKPLPDLEHIHRQLSLRLDQTKLWFILANEDLILVS